MKLLNETQTLRRTPRITVKELIEDTVILHLDTGNYYTLNFTGKEIWDYCSEARSIKEIMDFVASKYELPEEAFEQEIRPYLETLHKEKLLELVEVSK